MSEENIYESEKESKNDTCTHFCGAVSDNKTLTECFNVEAKPTLTAGEVIIKVPVVLAENTVEINIESNIKLDQPAIEIKRIKKNLFLTQCKLLPRTGKVFIKGFIRKNIEFATGKCVSSSSISGDIRHTTVNVPFECVTFVPLKHVKPLIKPNENPTIVETIDCQMNGKDLTQQDVESTEVFNEKIFCELVSAKFNEIDIETDSCRIDKHFPAEKQFQNITEKMVVLLTFKLLQMQQVKVMGIHGHHDHCDKK